MRFVWSSCDRFAQFDHPISGTNDMQFKFNNCRAGREKKKKSRRRGRKKKGHLAGFSIWTNEKARLVIVPLAKYLATLDPDQNASSIGICFE